MTETHRHLCLNCATQRIEQRQRADQQRREAARVAAAAAQAAAGSGGTAAPAAAPAAEMDLASLLATFPPDVRDDVLLTSDEALLRTLPPALLAEAQVRIGAYSLGEFVQRTASQVVDASQVADNQV